MKADKLSVSFEAELGRAVRAAAKERGAGLSQWLADAAATKLRNEALDEFLSNWEAENGPLTDEELTAAAAELGLPHPASLTHERGGP